MRRRIGALVVLILLAAFAPADRENNIAGKVIDENDSPLSEVLIRAYRAETQVGEAVSDSLGNYTVIFPAGVAIDVRYDLESYVTETLTALGGRANHEITKSLRRAASVIRWSVNEVNGTLSSYQFVAALDRGTERGREDFVRFGYGNTLSLVQQRVRELNFTGKLSRAEAEGFSARITWVRAAYAALP